MASYLKFTNQIDIKVTLKKVVTTITYFAILETAQGSRPMEMYFIITGIILGLKINPRLNNFPERSIGGFRAKCSRYPGRKKK
jgi:hypothetical protein